MASKLQGAEFVFRDLKRVRLFTRAKAKKITHDFAEKVLVRSRYYVPKDTLALLDSSHLEETQAWFGYTSAVVYETHYAVYVHENPVPYHAPPTQFKYVDRAYQDVRAEYDFAKEFVMTELRAF